MSKMTSMLGSPMLMQQGSPMLPPWVAPGSEYQAPQSRLPPSSEYQFTPLGATTPFGGPGSIPPPLNVPDFAQQTADANAAASARDNMNLPAISSSSFGAPGVPGGLAQSSEGGLDLIPFEDGGFPIVGGPAAPVQTYQTTGGGTTSGYFAQHPEGGIEWVGSGSSAPSGFGSDSHGG